MYIIKIIYKLLKILNINDIFNINLFFMDI